MKVLTVELADDVFDRAERRATELGTSLKQECTQLVERLGNGVDDDQWSAARSRLKELFLSVRGFQMGNKIPREELYDRGRVR